MKNIIITGGFGYVGSNVVKELILNNYNPIIIDNLSNSKNLNKKIQRVTKKKVEFFKINLSSRKLEDIFSKKKIYAVIHLAAKKSISESLVNPLLYYENNLSETISLVKLMIKFNVKKLIFSSSATVYGNQSSPNDESMLLEAKNPYARTKIQTEQILKDVCSSIKNFKCISLRYFNPIGSDSTGELFENAKTKSTNIMPMLLESYNKNKTFKIYGNDYETKDGTCIRDYIHVVDLARAHVQALSKIKSIQKNYEPINVGSGKGYSVLEIIKTLEKVNNIKINFSFGKRRIGDIPISYARINKAKNMLNWQPNKTLEDMCLDSFRPIIGNKSKMEK